MPALRLTVLSLRYSSWSIRPWLALTHAGADFETETVSLPQLLGKNTDDEAGPTHFTLAEREKRRALGSVAGLFPVLHVDGTPIHEALAICEWVAETYPNSGLWPVDGLRRARARAISTEMATGFTNLRARMKCHVFGRVPNFQIDEATQADIDRVFEIWGECLERSGGPFLFGAFGIADCMYFPVVTRFATYGVRLPEELAAYAAAVWEVPAVRSWETAARSAPKLEVYDAYLESLGGDPDAVR